MRLVDDFSIAARFLRHRALSSGLAILAVALGVSLMIWLQNVTAGVREAFVQHATPYNLLVGGVGSPVQMVLSCLFYLDRPVGNVSADVYEDLKGDPRVERAVPLALGDSFRGIPVVGTTGDFFQPLPSEARPLSVTAGRIFDTDFEVVLGSEVMKATAFELGSTFRTSHGLTGNEAHGADYTVVGMLAPTGGPADRAIYCTVGSVQRVHVEPSSEPPAGESGQVTAVLIRPRRLTDLPILQYSINSRGRAQAVFPADALYRLFDVIDIWKKVVEVLCWVVVGVALASVSIVLYSFVEERRDEIALLRALGASRGRVTRIILLQSEILSCGGAIAGILLGHILMALLGGRVRAFAGVELSWGIYTGWEGLVLIVLMLTGAVFGLLPAWKAYRVSVADNLV